MRNPAGWSGWCPQSDVGDEPIVAGRYRIAFACTACVVRTGQEDRALPMAFYECTSGAQRVICTRT